MDKALLNNLHQIQEFQMLLRELKGMRPAIPSYDPNNDNIEKMKFVSAQQQMFDVILHTISPFKDV